MPPLAANDAYAGAATSRPRQAIVLFAHGARNPRWSDTLHALAGALAARGPQLVRIAYLEMQSPGLVEVLEDLVAAGVTEARIAPMFWAAGGHVNDDLPALASEFSRRHPQLRLTLLPALSELPGMLDFLAGTIAPGPAPVLADRVSVPPLLRELGRGAHGARSLARADAARLMGAMLDGEVAELELGGVLIALRMKGESAAELAGFLDALSSRVTRVPAPARAAVVIPSYNGARSLPNLVPLLALLLARAGVPVLVHGQASEPSAAHGRPRVATIEVLRELGIGPCAGADEVPGWWARGHPAYLPLAACAPGLARLLQARRRLGLRNAGHTLAKLLQPVQGPALLLASYTHPDFGRLQGELFTATSAWATSMRGTEGEAVAHPLRGQPITLWRAGTGAVLAVGDEQAVAGVPLPGLDGPATADWTRDVLADRRAIPPPVLRQVEALLAALDAGPGGDPGSRHRQ